MGTENNQPRDGEAAEDSLYKLFKENIGRFKTSDVYFDEDDLIEIYDYANDRFDDFVKMEVLFYAAEKYPDSRDLNSRRRFMYYEMGNDDAVKLLMQRTENPTTLDKILLYRQKSYISVTDLKKVVEEADMLNDEEVYQLMDIEDSLDAYRWLKNNYQMVARKCEYPQTLYYELACLAIEHGDWKTSIKMAEELTMLEPFNVEFWELLASSQIDANMYQEALATLDYSLALDPKSVKSLIMKANALASLNPNDEEPRNILLSLVDNPEFAQLKGWSLLTGMLIRSNDSAKAISLLRDLSQKEDVDLGVIETLMSMDTSNIDEYVSLLRKKHFPNDPNFWFGHAQPFLMDGRIQIAAILLWEGFLRRKYYNGLNLLMEVLYQAGRYEDVIKVYRQMRHYAENFPDCELMYILSFARLGKRRQALDFARQAMNKYKKNGFDNAINISILGEPELGDNDDVDEKLPMNYPTVLTTTLFVHGLEFNLRNIIAALSNPTPVPVDDYDPLSRE